MADFEIRALCPGCQGSGQEEKPEGPSENCRLCDGDTYVVTGIIPDLADRLNDIDGKQADIEVKLDEIKAVVDAL